jgi:hypothetical protein
MVKAEPCPKCGYTHFSSHYFAARPKVLWFAPKLERIELWCLRCSYEWERPDLVGTVLRAPSTSEMMSGG